MLLAAGKDEVHIGQELNIGTQQSLDSFLRIFCNLELSQDIFNSIYEKYEGHTWYVQCLLNRLYGYDRDVDIKLINYTTMIQNPCLLNHSPIKRSYIM